MDLQSATDIVRNIATSFAVVVGGGWAYFKFVRGRTFANRAELEVSASLQRGISGLYLYAVVTLKNDGLSKLPLNSKYKAIRLYGLMDEDGSHIETAKWKRLSTRPILDQHEWLEGEETVTDTVLYSLPSASKTDASHAAYQLEALVGARRRRLTQKGTQWQSRVVVFAPAEYSMSGAVQSHVSVTDVLKKANPMKKVREIKKGPKL
jgi:hypothetical protein